MTISGSGEGDRDRSLSDGSVGGPSGSGGPRSGSGSGSGVGGLGLTAVVTLFSAARLEHALNQFAMLRRPAVAAPDAAASPLVVGVWLDAGEAPAIEGVTVIHVPPAPAGAHAGSATPLAAGACSATAPAAGARLRLAAGRNAGAAAALAAGAGLLVFLDADCLPGPELLERYAEAAAGHPESVLCGAVTYLPEGADPRTPAQLAAATAPHAARPDLPAGETRAATADEHRLFWSLSFACTAEAWRATGGFAELYEGYGAEDTDYASTLRARGIELRWVGGAHAYHQYHPTSSPPWQHLDDILRNGALYNARWGSWPMEGWLVAFEQAGAIERQGDGWRRVPDAAAAAGGTTNPAVPDPAGSAPTP